MVEVVRCGWLPGMGVYKLDVGIVRIRYFSARYLENAETFLRSVTPFTILTTAEVSLV